METIEHSPNKSVETRSWAGENVLHIYPKTFNESRADGEAHQGVGSIRGIIDKLDWIRDTGVTAIWLGPIYKSPGLDGNYDVSDYYSIDPELGTMEDVDEMIAEAHARGIRVIFDLIPNHTSDQHEAFAASKDPNHPGHDKCKDHYIWRDPVPGELPANIVGEDRLEGLPDGMTVPNNWTSIFSLPQIDKVREEAGGELPSNPDIPAVTAWVWSSERQQFYLAEFMKQQPTLNWQNPAVREQMKDVVRFWLDKGVDSFRVDVMNHIGKDAQFRDELPAEVGGEHGQYNPGVTNPHDQWRQERLVSSWPELGQYAKDLLSVLDEPAYSGRNIRLVFEDWMSALGDDDRLDRLDPDKANVFNFMTLTHINRDNWQADKIRSLIGEYYSRHEELSGSVPNQVTGNHDVDTLRTRLGSQATARAAHLMLAALPGMLYTWQGDMLGRPNAIIPPELQRDGSIGKRDGERIPMQWDSTENSGFSQADSEELWLRGVDQKYYLDDNLELQSKDPRSPYRMVRDVLRRRLSDPALREGGLRLLQTDRSDVLAFSRPDPTDARRQVISLTNFSSETVQVRVLDAHQGLGRVTMSSMEGRLSDGEELDLTDVITLQPDTSYLVDSVP